MAFEVNESRASGAVRVSMVLGLVLAVVAAFAQPDPGQPRSTNSAVIGAETGKVLNEAIEALRADKLEEAQRTLARLDFEKLSPYERSKVEQILFNVAFAQERYDDARQHARNAVDAGGMNAQEISQMRYQAAQVLLSQERWTEGARALEEWFASAVSPNGGAYYLLAVAYYQLGDFARALPAAQRAVDLANEPQEAWLGMLLALRLKNDQYRDAVPLLQMLVAMVPAKKTYWLQLSSVYGQLEDYPNALSTMQVAYNAGLVTEDAEIRRLADLLLLQNLPYRGAQVLEAAIADGTVTVDAKLFEKLANCWLAAGEIDKALAPLARGAELADSGNLYVRLGEVSVMREEWMAAEQALERGIAKGRLADTANAQLLMGITLYHQRRLPEARGWLQQAAQSTRYRGTADYLRLIDAGTGASSMNSRAAPTPRWYDQTLIHRIVE